jgi:hypothetical protein
VVCQKRPAILSVESFCKLKPSHTSSFASTLVGVTKQLDWVGTLEKLQTKTLPLLTQMLPGTAEMGLQRKPANVMTDKILNQTEANYFLSMLHRDNLSAQVVEQVRKSLMLDQELYNRVAETFTFEKNWPRF